MFTRYTNSFLSFWFCTCHRELTLIPNTGIRVCRSRRRLLPYWKRVCCWFIRSIDSHLQHPRRKVQRDLLYETYATGLHGTFQWWCSVCPLRLRYLIAGSPIFVSMVNNNAIRWFKHSVVEGRSLNAVGSRKTKGETQTRILSKAERQVQQCDVMTINHFWCLSPPIIRYQGVPEVRRIIRHRHLPGSIYSTTVRFQIEYTWVSLYV